MCVSQLTFSFSHLIDGNMIPIKPGEISPKSDIFNTDSLGGLRTIIIRVEVIV